MRRAHAHTRTHERGNRATASPRRGNRQRPPPGMSQPAGRTRESVHKCPAMCKKVVKSLEVSGKSIIFASVLNKKHVEQIKVEMKPAGLSMEVDKQEFALALKTWRLRNGLTQKQVGERWGCSRYTILRAEGAKNLTWEMAYRLFAKLSNELRKEVENG